jgi:hypothetical protein
MEGEVADEPKRRGPEQDAEGSDRSDVKRAQRLNAKARNRKEKRLGQDRLVKTAPTTPEATFEEIQRVVCKTLVPVNQPVALICQAQRSGGTMLRNLFDGHPELHVHPYEWHIGYPERHNWPTLRPEATPDAWWVRLREEALGRRFSTGVRHDQSKYRGDGAPDRSDVYRMALPPLLHRRVFAHALIKLERPVAGDRDILDAYLTGLFNAWLNNHTLDAEPKRWVVAFAPRLAWGNGLDKFFAAYPDGRMISILRDPLSWYMSGRGRQLEVKNPGKLLELWTEGTDEMLAAKGRYGDQVTIVRFDDLVRDTAGVMRLLSDRLGITYDDLLIQPTFNGAPVGANSSYVLEASQAVSASPLDRHKAALPKEERRLVRKATTELFQAARELADRPSGSRWKVALGRAVDDAPTNDLLVDVDLYRDVDDETDG